jgi:NAD(P)-dependent dehydrogenase (short-subunit alcohol dehydrogenase family)
MSGAQGGSRVAVVTGGTAGVGRAVVRELVARGYDVAVLARGRDGLNATLAEIEDAGRRGVALPVDVADAAAVRDAAGQVEEDLGPIDVWVNNAFVGTFAYFEDVTPEEFGRVTQVTYLGQVNGTRAALERMKRRDRGSIVNVSSALAYQGIPLQSAYCGAKHGIVGFTQSLRIELRHRGVGVQVSLVALPGVNTPQFGWVLRRGMRHHPQPVPPVYQPEVAARAIVHVAEHPRRSTWVGLPTYGTILANRFAPGLIEWYLARTNIQAQQAPEHDPPGRRTDLWEPVAGDHGAHGVFDDKAHGHSALLAVTQRLHDHPGPALAAAGVAAAAVVAGRHRSKT